MLAIRSTFRPMRRTSSTTGRGCQCGCCASARRRGWRTSSEKLECSNYGATQALGGGADGVQGRVPYTLDEVSNRVARTRLASMLERGSACVSAQDGSTRLPRLESFRSSYSQIVYALNGVVRPAA